MRQNNYTIAATAARAEFLKYDQDRMIRRFALDHDDERLYIAFYGTRYSINRETGEVLRCADGAPAGFNAVLSIYDVLCYGKENAHLSGEWQTLSNLSPASNFGASGRNLFTRVLAQFSGRVEALRAACVALGGRTSTRADVGFEFSAFPFLPIVLQFWEGDEEFEPRMNFLFDANTLDYIRFETAWYVADHLLSLLEAHLGAEALCDRDGI